MKQLQLVLIILLLGTALAPGSLRAQDIVNVVGNSLLTMTRESGSLKLPYYSNHPFDQSNSSIRRLIIVQHGTLRNADHYYQSILTAANDAGLDNWEESTMVIAPQFLTQDDLSFHNLSNEYAYWEYMGWRQGDLSRTTGSRPRPWQISSYAVADTIITRAVETFSNLENIVVAGHSAGGQFVNRFTAGSRVHSHLASAGISIRGIVSNPSTYMYLSPKRKNYQGLFVVPTAGQISVCPDYDNYKYGLINLNNYMDQDVTLLRGRYQEREVVYLLGELDTVADFYLDVSCSANFQGPYRLERGQRFLQHLVDEFGVGIRVLHREVIIPDVGHNHGEIFASSCGVRYLFDDGICHDAVAQCQVTPEVITETLDVGQSHIVWVDISNTGETGSLVTYELNLNDPVPLPGKSWVKDREPSRDLTGSNVIISPRQYEPGNNLEVTLTVTNNSPDFEFISETNIEFPAGLSVLSASDLNLENGLSINYSGQLGDGATASWSGVFLEGGFSGSATLVLDFASVGGEVVVPWQLVGDGYGGAPHAVEGNILFESLGPFVHLVSPNGGETLRQGEIQTIRFNTSNEVNNVDIFLRRNQEAWVPLLQGVPAADAEADWLISGNLGPDYNLQIQSSDNSALSDTCDSRFTIGRSLAWIHPDLFDGTLEAGESTSIGITLSADGLLSKTYQAEIVFSQNAGPDLIVPVSMTVNEPSSSIDDLPGSGTDIRFSAAPNPFNPRTVLTIEQPQSEFINLTIYDARGLRVKLLANDFLGAGTHSFTWSGDDERGGGLPSGVYFARLQGKQKTVIRKLLLIR